MGFYLLIVVGDSWGEGRSEDVVIIGIVILDDWYFDKFFLFECFDER